MEKLTNDQILSNLYYDLETGYGSVKSWYDQAKEKKSRYNIRRSESIHEKTT